MSALSLSDIQLIYDICFDKVYRFFYYKVVSKEIAEDLTSETFLIFVKKSKNETSIENPQYYLFGIAKNVFLKFLERKYQNTHINIENIENFGSYMDETINELDHIEPLETKANKFISLLPEKQKIILELRLIQKKTLSQICEFLKKDMNYVKTTQQRGINNLKQLIACTP